MSILGKEWVLKNSRLEDRLSQDLDDESVTFHDPFLFKGMNTAIDRIKKAIESKERIVVFGDYDVDGISGTAILVHTLRELGATVSYRLPDRQDGYGLNISWISEMKDKNVKLFITVDCGISNAAEVKQAADFGLDVIVTDHHTIPEVPPTDAIAILHPALGYVFPHLSGSGVAFKLAVALMSKLRGPKEASIWQTKLVDLASLGTVADCVPLVGENRHITKKGLEQMAKTEWSGLKTLLVKNGITEIHGHDSDLIGFRLAPRLNAAGRIETPYFALQLLLNENNTARQLAEKLEQLNKQRQNFLEEALKKAEERLDRQNLLNNRVLILWDSDWRSGIVGLIAARLSEKHNRPAIVMEERGDELIASCRSPENFNLVKALQSMEDLFETFGGHSAAAGFTLRVESLTEFIDKMEKYAGKHLNEQSLKPTLNIDYKVSLSQITQSLADQVATLAPFGEGNPKPRFVVRNANPADLQTVGRDHSHLRFKVKSFSAIAFRFGSHYETLQRALFASRPVDVVFELDKNYWKGREQIQLKVLDLKVN
jgi:single-stranded-DNA-specific exonuclease